MTARSLALAGLATLTLAACSGSSSTSGSVPPSPSIPPPPKPPATPPVVAALLTGKYSGTWNNTTFGSNGTLSVATTFDQPTSTLNMTITLGGNVFGGAAPAPETVPMKIDGTGSTFTGHSATLGDLTVTYDAAGFSVKGSNVPNANIASFTATGTMDASSTISVQYTVMFKDGSSAKGTGKLTKSG